MLSPGVPLSSNFHMFTNLEALITYFVDEIIFMYISQDNYVTIFKIWSKFFKLDFSSTWTENFQMSKLDLEKAEEKKKRKEMAEEQEIKMPTPTRWWDSSKVM